MIHPPLESLEEFWRGVELEKRKKEQGEVKMDGKERREKKVRGKRKEKEGNLVTFLL